VVDHLKEYLLISENSETFCGTFYGVPQMMGKLVLSLGMIAKGE